MLYTAFRFLLWMWAAARYFAGTFGDVIIRRDSVGRRARRLRGILEGLGPTFIKVGQQLSVRADMLPYEFCRELSSMLECVPPMPGATAIEIIERSLGATVEEVFASFQPEPIGSGSLACVYKAQLPSGQWVAVKVRRPDVARKLAGDVRALSGILLLAEWLSLFKSGFTANLRTEFARMLMEETDFIREARNTENFGNEARRTKQHQVTAPRIHRALCTADIIVTDLVIGTFMSDIVRAIDRGDTSFLEQLRAQGIDLKTVARNLMRTAHWELLESILFHADPHPANICVQPGNVIVFIDFGSCGRLTGNYRRIWQRFYLSLGKNNVQAMVDAAVAILEPLPHLDVDAFRREVELMLWDWVYAMNSDHAEWWEKSSGTVWMKFADIARRYHVYLSAEIVRIFRATFIFDTTIFQLSNSVNMRTDFKRYQREAGRRARRRVRRKLWRRLEHGLKYTDYLAIEDTLRMGRQALFRVQHLLDTPDPVFGREIGKLAFTVTMMLRLGASALGVYLIGMVAVNGYEWATHNSVDVTGTLSSLVNQTSVKVIGGLAVLVLLRKTVMKLREHDK
ncbi:MAG TPA: AarF/UbiB family protein [Kofleriaceae bacterium]|nr:AarF/UbiB family protein [Kofleriaceae bacterium]